MHADGWRDGGCLVHVSETFGETGETVFARRAEKREQTEERGRENHGEEVSRLVNVFRLVLELGFPHPVRQDLS